MSDFNNIKKYFPRIQVWAKPHTDNQMVILAEELESLLQSAQVVYGNSRFGWAFENDDEYTHTALILAITPIKKKTKAEAALEFMQMFVEQKTTWHSQQAWEEAKRILEMKDEA